MTVFKRALPITSVSELILEIQSTALQEGWILRAGSSPAANLKIESSIKVNDVSARFDFLNEAQLGIQGDNLYAGLGSKSQLSVAPQADSKIYITADPSCIVIGVFTPTIAEIIYAGWNQPTVNEFYQGYGRVVGSSASATYSLNRSGSSIGWAGNSNASNLVGNYLSGNNAFVDPLLGMPFVAPYALRYASSFRGFIPYINSHMVGSVSGVIHETSDGEEYISSGNQGMRIR